MRDSYGRKCVALNIRSMGLYRAIMKKAHNEISCVADYDGNREVRCRIADFGHVDIRFTAKINMDRNEADFWKFRLKFRHGSRHERIVQRDHTHVKALRMVRDQSGLR